MSGSNRLSKVDNNNNKNKSVLFRKDNNINNNIYESNRVDVVYYF